MGYCYEGRLLCCDACSKAGARKRPCPSGYCQAPALCRDCNAKVRADGSWKRGHAGCAAGHAAYVAEQVEKERIFATGAWVRCSAVGVDDGSVKVWFRNKDQGELIAHMPPDVYRAFGLLTTTTLDDYKRIAEKLGTEVRM